MSVVPNIASNPVQALENLKNRKDPAALKAVAKEMETLFAHELIKAMRETVNTKESKGFGRETYMSMFDMELARILSERGLGLQEMMVNSISRQAGSATDTKTETEPQAPAATENIPVKSAAKVQNSSKTDLHMPVNGRISSRFGMRTHPVYGTRKFHRGLDIAAPMGSDIRPIEGGKVIFSGEKPGYGNIVIIDHGNGMTSQYAHNQQNLVQAGDEVGRNTVIARVGSEGVSTGPHLHLEVKKNGKNIDPRSVLAMK